MSPPPAAALMAALEATWPPAEIVERSGWRLRRGAGGGKRVSAATKLCETALVEDAEAAMAAWGQPPLFQMTPDQETFDADLARRGFEPVDPTLIYTAAPSALLDDRPETARIVAGDFRLALMDEIWQAGGVGPARRAVMDRADRPKAYLLARLGDRPAAVAFVAVHGGVAMAHAIETLSRHRRKGAARMLIAAAARVAAEAGAETLALAVTEANAPARALYGALGFAEAARYHYRRP